MGYDGLNNWINSDMAADLVGEILQFAVKSLKKELKEVSNSINTEGSVNVALFVESFIKPNVKEWSNSCIEGLAEVLEETVKQLSTLIEDVKKNKDNEWDDEENRLWHLSNYKRMLKNVKFVLSRIER